MTSPFPLNRLLTVEEYLELDQASQQRYEYVDGDVYPVASVTYRHNQIAGNIFAALRQVAKGGTCAVSVEKIKLRIGKSRFYYPDIMVACGDIDLDADMTTHPCLVTEITSPSTARFDRSEKLLAYRRVESLKAYLIVEQGWRRVTRHWRDAHGEWQYEDFNGEGAIPIPCPETTLTLDEIYEGLAPLTVKELEAIGYAVTPII